MINKSLVQKNKNINHIEIFIGNPKLNMFDCSLNKPLFQKITHLFSNREKCVYRKYYYKNMIFESINNKSRVYEKKYISLEKETKYIINFLELVPKNKIEFPCKKKYIHEENYKGSLLKIDDNTTVYFFEDINCIKIEIDIDRGDDATFKNFKNTNIIIDKICSNI